MTDTLPRPKVDVGAFMAALAGPGRDVEASVADLAELWPPAPDRLAAAFYAAGIVIDEWDALELVVRIGEELALEATRGRVPSPPAPGMAELVKTTRRAHRGDGLTVSDDLAARLPLMWLAGEVAQMLGSLSVVMVDSERIAPAMGYTNLEASKSEAVILLDGSLSGMSLQFVWAHELSHVLDPRPDFTHSSAEAFADYLGWRLLEEDPTSLDAAAPLIGAALLATLDLAWPESGTLATLLEWALAEVRGA